MFYCKNNVGDLEGSITSAKTKLENLSTLPAVVQWIQQILFLRLQNENTPNAWSQMRFALSIFGSLQPLFSLSAHITSTPQFSVRLILFRASTFLAHFSWFWRNSHILCIPQFSEKFPSGAGPSFSGPERQLAEPVSANPLKNQLFSVSALGCMPKSDVIQWSAHTDLLRQFSVSFILHHESTFSCLLSRNPTLIWDHNKIFCSVSSATPFVWVQNTHFSMQAHITLIHQLSMQFHMHLRGSKVLVLEIRWRLRSRHKI